MRNLDMPRTLCATNEKKKSLQSISIENLEISLQDLLETSPFSSKFGDLIKHEFQIHSAKSSRHFIRAYTLTAQIFALRKWRFLKFIP